MVRPVRTLALVITAAATSLLAVVVVPVGSPAQPSNGSVTLNGGQTETVRCLTSGETWTSANVFPHVVRCPLPTPPTTTTTIAPTTSTTGRHHRPPPTTTVPTPTTVHAPTTLPTPTTTPTGNVFRLFGPTSLWNTVKTPTVFATSANAFIQGLSFGINNGAWDHPFFIATSSDPMTTFNLGGGWGHNALTITAPAPSGMSQASGGDADMDVLLPAGTDIGGGWGTTSGRWLLDMYGVSGSGTNWTASYYGLSDGLDGPGFGGPTTYPVYYAIGTTAVGSPQAGGTILASDIAAGVIDHGLTMACDYGDEGNSPSGDGDELAYPDGPAVSNDDGGGGGPLSEGSLLFIPPGTAMAPGLDTMGKQLWTAAGTEGVYVTDQAGGGCYFYGDGSSSVDNAFSSNDFQIVGQALELVNTWSSSAIKTAPKGPKEAPVTAPKEKVQPAPCPKRPKSVVGCPA